MLNWSSGLQNWNQKLTKRIKGLLDSTTIGSWQVDAILNELRALIARSESEGHDQSTTDS